MIFENIDSAWLYILIWKWGNTLLMSYVKVKELNIWKAIMNSECKLLLEKIKLTS